MSFVYNGYGNRCPALNGGLRSSWSHGGARFGGLGLGYGRLGNSFVGGSRFAHPIGGFHRGNASLCPAIQAKPSLLASQFVAPAIQAKPSLLASQFVAPAIQAQPLVASQFVAPAIQPTTNVTYEDVPFQRSYVEMQPVTHTVQDSYTVEKREINIPQTHLQPVTQYVPVQSYQPAVSYQQVQQQVVHPSNSPVSIQRKLSQSGLNFNNANAFQGSQFNQVNSGNQVSGQTFNPLFSNNLGAQNLNQNLNQNLGNSKLYDTLR